MSSAALVADRLRGGQPRPVISHEPGSRVSHEDPIPTEVPAEVVARIRAGDARALETLFRGHYRALCDFAVRYVRDAAAAEDLVQDLFADLWSRRESWVLRGSVRAYLFTAVRNRALNLRKRQAMERDWERDESASEVPALHQVPDGADEVLEREELQHRVSAAVESLPERCRLVMHLRWHERMPHAEIAAVMGISVKGVEMQLARGLKALRLLVVR
ncbi:MAG: polymerase sigma-70 factor [Geminicoccaceae bacterium]|nr:polymerase sigma-70 factor [Geminicoccaceae bacterium]